jgi:3-deoxy-D-manno-octulosonic-acid transferase
MRRLYNLWFWVYFVLSSPYQFLRVWARGDWAKSFSQRFGHYDINLKQSITNRHLIWLHVPGLEELELCRELILALEVRLPNVKFMASTTMVDTMRALHRRLPAHTGKIYHPIDRRDCVARALGTMHPRAIILLGSQLQPNFIWRARGRFPLFLVNAQLTNAQFSRYRQLGFLFRRFFESLTFIEAQSEEQAARFRQVGAPAEVVQVLGDLAGDPKVMEKTVESIIGCLTGSDLYIAAPGSRSSPSAASSEQNSVNYSSPRDR